MKKVYVASPVRPVLDHSIDEYSAYAQISWFASQGCKAVKEMGHIPVSPILAFDGVYDEFTERDAIDKACEALLLSCDYIHVVHTPYNKESKGIARELELAKKHGIETLYIMPKERE